MCQAGVEPSRDIQGRSDEAFEGGAQRYGASWKLFLVAMVLTWPAKSSNLAWDRGKETSWR